MILQKSSEIIVKVKVREQWYLCGKQHLFELEIFCKIVHIFTVIFAASLLTISINFFKKKKKLSLHFQVIIAVSWCKKNHSCEVSNLFWAE